MKEDERGGERGGVKKKFGKNEKDGRGWGNMQKP